MARARARADRSLLVWPGYVDALTTLLLAITFLLVIYVLAQFFLSQALSGREKALAELSVQIDALERQLLGAREEKEALAADAARLGSALDAAAEARRAADERAGQLRAEVERLDGLVASRRLESESLAAALEEERRTAAEARSTVDELNEKLARLNHQLAQIAAALEVSETRNRESQVEIADLGRRLDAALAEKVIEMARYRSEFFGRLRDVLGERPEVRTVGDRFVFQSEVLFPSGSAELSPEGKQTLAAFAKTLLGIAREIPPDLGWVLRVDGHTDRRPIHTERFPSNWELSAGRALSVVEFLIAQGVSPQRLAAAGFGEFQPIDGGTGDAAMARNRRIEMRLTDR
jgi:chemotaxis protein MotB